LKETESNKVRRKTCQYLLPERKPYSAEGNYNIYPSYKLEDDQIFEGFESLANIILNHKTVIIDGYIGVFFNHFRENLDIVLKAYGLRTSWKITTDFLLPSAIIDDIISPFLGGDDPLFGKRTTLALEDFFNISQLKELLPDSEADINLIIGPGAALAGWSGLLLYIDLPKNEIQFRSRAGSISNLGASAPSDPQEMYKRFYFVDWIVLNKHKRSILSEIDLFVDAMRPGCPSCMNGELLRHSLSFISHNVFRVKPWFETGVWGGKWIMDHITGLNKEVPNYAWSYEMIAPENGILFESSGRLLEVSFDLLMYQEGEAVLGDCFTRFGADFPIRFDFLDTYDGGNLSVQCHPRPDYMKKNFGEDFTQEESYYILDTKDNAAIYLGFQEDIDSSKFKNELEESFQYSKTIDIEKYVQKLPVSKHDLFLIPYGTIHGSGKNNLVLEISSTPYIFTFKMYDWLRPDLDGKTRPLNIQRGMDNLFFDRKGRYVKEKLISKTTLIDHGEGWKLYHLPTHETHLYDIHRFHLKDSIEIKTDNKFHVLSLVEGTTIVVETGNGFSQQFSYAETFVIPAAAGSYKIINKSLADAIIIKAFVK
jgi:mannose-6-phosphate isomerase class I